MNAGCSVIFGRTSSPKATADAPVVWTGGATGVGDATAVGAEGSCDAVGRALCPRAPAIGETSMTRARMKRTVFNLLTPSALFRQHESRVIITQGRVPSTRANFFGKSTGANAWMQTGIVLDARTTTAP